MNPPKKSTKNPRKPGERRNGKLVRQVAPPVKKPGNNGPTIAQIDAINAAITEALKGRNPNHMTPEEKMGVVRKAWAQVMGGQ